MQPAHPSRRPASFQYTLELSRSVVSNLLQGLYDLDSLSCRVIKVTLDTGEVIVGMSLVKDDLELVKEDLIKHPVVAGTTAAPAPEGNLKKSKKKKQAQ